MNGDLHGASGPRTGRRREGRLTEEALASMSDAIVERARPVPTAFGAPTTAASDLYGTDLDGGASSIEVTGSSAREWTVLLFLSATCDGCDRLWPLLEPGELARRCPAGIEPGKLRVVGVLRPAASEQTVAMRRVVPPGGLAVVTDAAWNDYRVHGAPFFVAVTRSSPTVVSEGVAWSPDQVALYLADAWARQADLGERPDPGRREA